MRCPNCGKMSNEKICPLCGTTLARRQNHVLNLYSRFVKITYIKQLNFLFPVPIIIIFTLFGVILATATFEDGTSVTFFQWFFLMILVFIFFVVPFDTIRWFAWGKKKYNKKDSLRSSILADTVKWIEKAKELTDVIETTTDIKSFEESITLLQKIFMHLQGYVKYGVFTDITPKQNLKEFLDNEASVRAKFRQRTMCLQPTIPAAESTAPPIPIFDYMEGHEFEYFCAGLLRKNGFENVEVTQGSGDHGIDILAEKDSITYAIQCKCYSSNVGNAAVQQAHSGKSIYKKDIAVVLTNRYFTQQATDEATQLGVKLWDRDKLSEFIASSK